MVFDGAPEELTEAVARDLYGLEAGEAMNVIPAPQLITGRGPIPVAPERPRFPQVNRRERMSISRRLMLGLVAGAAMFATPAVAQEWKARYSRARLCRRAGRERLRRDRAHGPLDGPTSRRSSA